MTEVCFVLAPGQNHFFVEVAEAMQFELGRLGVPARLSRDGFPPLDDDLAYVLTPPHEFAGLAPPEHWPTTRQLERTLLLCLEQPGTKFFDGDVRIARSGAGAVLDVSSTGVAAFGEAGVSAHHAPLGWTEAWTYADPHLPGPERDIDVLHLGAYSPRRAEILARSADALEPWRTRLVLGDDHRPNADPRANFLLDEAKWGLHARARVLLNIHSGDRSYFEWLRVVQAVCNGVLVVSETSTDTEPLRAGEHFVTGAAEELMSLAEPYLEDEDRRIAAVRAAYEQLREQRPLSRSAALLAELATACASGGTRVGGAADAAVPWPDNSGIREEVRAATAKTAVTAARRDFDATREGSLLTLHEDLEMTSSGLERLTAALADDASAAFAWGMLAEGDAEQATLRNTFPWQPWRLDDPGYIERPVLWRSAALLDLGVEADPDRSRDRDLFRKAAERGMHGVHVAEIVARRRVVAVRDAAPAYPEFDWWKGWEDLDQIQSPAAIFARPAGLAALGRGSYFTEPYTIDSPHRVHVGHGVKVSERLAISVYESADGAVGGSFTIGDGCLIGADLHAHCTHDVELGNYVGISARVAIGDFISDLYPELAGGDQPTDLSIRIHDGAIVGIGVVILPGVTIGERAAIGGGSVVTRDVPPRSLVFGNPARVVGSWDEVTGEWVTGLRR